MEAHMEKRLYGLFEKREGKWVRLFPEHAYRKEAAIRLFQTQLLNGFFEGKVRELRPLPKAQ
jgi:hypothetical protein